MTITPYENAPLTEAESADLEHLEQVIDQGLQTFYMTGAALATIRDTKLYRKTHKTFEEYCEKRWNLKQSRAYQLIDAAGVVTNLRGSTIVELPRNEAQTRPLSTLSVADQSLVWQQAVETAPEGKPTAAHVERMVERFRRVESQPAPYDLTERDPEPEPEAPAPSPIRALVPDAVIAPPTPFVRAVGDALANTDGAFHRNAILEEFHAACQRQMGVYQKSRDLLRHIDPAVIAGLLSDDEAKSIAWVIGYTNELLGWFQRAAEARESASTIRRVK